MWALGAAFSRLWRTEWQRRQRAMELRARVQLHALAMDLLKKPALSPRVLRDPTLRRQLLVKLRQQSAMDARSAVHTHLVATAPRTLGVAVQTNDDTELERRREGEWRKQKVEDGREGDGREYRERLYKYPAMFIFFCFFFAHNYDFDDFNAL